MSDNSHELFFLIKVQIISAVQARIHVGRFRAETSGGGVSQSDYPVGKKGDSSFSFQAEVLLLCLSVWRSKGSETN